MPHKLYIGDGVYVAIGDGAVTITTENGVSVTNRIVLEPEVLANLLDFLDAIRVQHEQD